MTPKKKSARVPRSADDRDQSRLFIKKAREIEADEKQSIAEELLRYLAKKPPEPHTKRKRKVHPA
jgi:hypothetical protein